MCETIGIYDLTARLPGPKSPTYRERYVAGCTELHIKEISGGVVTFEGEDTYRGRDTYSVPILSAVQTFTWEKGIVSCPPETTEGSAVRTSINCWQGVVNGYSVLVRAGKEVDRTTEKQAASCSTKGFYSVEAWAPDDWQNVQTWVPQDGSWHQVYHDWFYPPRCTLRIVDADGSKLYFRDESNNSLSIDIAPYLTTPTPTP